TAKQGDTLLSNDGRFFVYDEPGNRWFLWYRFDIASAVITNNTLTGDGTPGTPLSVNPTTVALKGEINPALKGVDNGDGTYTFTTIDGSTSFTINAGLSNNIYNSDGTLTGNREVQVGNNNLYFRQGSFFDPDNGLISLQSNGTFLLRTSVGNIRYG